MADPRSTGRPTGVRLNKRQADMVRANIQASNIVHRLNQHLSGEIELTSAQIRSAEILLNKCLPNLQATEVTNYEGNTDDASSLTDAELAQAIEEARNVSALQRRAKNAKE